MRSHTEINSSNYYSFGCFQPYIRYYAEDYYDTEWELKRRKISDHELLFFTGGEGEFSIEGRNYHVKKNDVLLFKPGLQHEGKSVRQPFGFFCMHFDLYISKAVPMAGGRDSLLYRPVMSQPVKYYKALVGLSEHMVPFQAAYIKGLFSKLVAVNQKRENGFQLLSGSMFTELLVELFQEQGNSGIRHEYNRDIASIMGFIEQNYAEKIRLSDISGYIHLQPSYISSMFKRYTGVTISDYIALYRIAAAKKRLLEQNGKISEIAMDTGFYDVHHFSRVFKKYEGLTPGEYKKINSAWQKKE